MAALLAAALITVGVHVCSSIAFYLIARGLPGEAPPLGIHFVIVPLSISSGVVPLPMGPLEFVLEFFYTHLPMCGSIAKGQGLLVALVNRLNSILMALVGVLLYLRKPPGTGRSDPCTAGPKRRASHAHRPPFAGPYFSIATACWSTTRVSWSARSKSACSKACPRRSGELKAAGMFLAVVSNQAVVARGLISESELAGLNRLILDQIEHAGGPRLDAVYYCPHHPEATLPEYRVACQCRKPRPGMIVQAAAEHGLDLQASFLVGDRMTDIAAGAAAGCRTVLVTCGRHDAPPIVTVDPLRFRLPARPYLPRPPSRRRMDPRAAQRG